MRTLAHAHKRTRAHVPMHNKASGAGGHGPSVRTKYGKRLQIAVVHPHTHGCAWGHTLRRPRRYGAIHHLCNIESQNDITNCLELRRRVGNPSSKASHPSYCLLPHRYSPQVAAKHCSAETQAGLTPVLAVLASPPDHPAPLSRPHHTQHWFAQQWTRSRSTQALLTPPAGRLTSILTGCVRIAEACSARGTSCTSTPQL